LRNWLRTVAPRCTWLAASSTGTVTVAAAGLLDRQRVATHWLASPFLESYGASASPERIVETGNVITCEGHVTAMHVALLLTRRLFGPETVADVRRRLVPAVDAAKPGRWPAGRRRRRDRREAQRPRPRNRELDAPDVIELEPLRPRS
jgi:transcriptional regulator GlxA family with amidase domain